MTIQETSKIALKMSKSAYATGKKARSMEEETFKKLIKMNNDAEEAMKLARQTSKKVSMAMNKTKATLENAKIVLDEANRPIAASGIKLIQGKFLFL